MKYGWRWHTVADWLQNTDPIRGAEIGVKEGRFIAHLLRQYPRLEMYAVDRWAPDPTGNETYTEWNWPDIYATYRQAIRPHEFRVIEFRESSVNAAKMVANYSLDFVFIDAQHDYKSVRDDILAWRPKVKPGGLLCGHDYQPNFPGVVRAVDELISEPIFGVQTVWGKWV